MPYQAETYSINLLSEENVKKYVLPYYSLEDSEVTSIKFKDTDKQRAVYKIDKGGKSYCLKKVYFKKDELLFVYSAIEWFYRNGINVPKLLPTISHERYVDYNNMLFILTTWIDGDKCDYDNIEHMTEASINLAKMHKSCKKFIPINGSTVKTGYDDLYVSIKKHFEQLLLCSNLAFKYKDRFSKFFLQNFENNLYLAQVSVEVASTINNDNLSKSLCHMDYVNKNIIFDKGKKLWVIDFDKCSIDYCVHDISYFLRRFLKRDITKWDLELAISCLNLYEKIHPLNIDELKYILVYLAFPQKYWKISRDYYNNIKKCNKNSFFILLSKASEKSEEQIQFVKEFKNYIENRYHVKI